VAELEREITLLSEAGCKVVLVSFGTPHGSATWLAKNGYILDMFVDTERALYRLLGQGRRCWANIPAIKYAAVMGLHGREMPPLINGDVHDDLQMGGNITISSANSEVMMAFAQSGVTDRPSVKQILEKI